MPLSKQDLTINFLQGLDTKTDPFQVPPGKFLDLENTVFGTGGLLQKRNGFLQLASLPDLNSTFVTTFNGNLTAIGTELQALSTGSMSWISKGPIHPLKLDTLPLVRSGTNQSQGDSVLATNGLICTVYTDNVPVDGSNVSEYKYVIADSVTGQNIVFPKLITTSMGGVVTGSPRVFVLGKYFVIVFSANFSGTYHLQYIGINILNPTSATAAQDISTQYSPSSTVAFDGTVANSNLYVAWNGSDLGGAIRVNFIDMFLQLHAVTSFPGFSATMFTLSVDQTVLTPVLYVSFYDSGTQDGYTVALDLQLNTIYSPTQIINGEDVANLASTAQDNIETVVYEVNNSYGYDSAIPTNYLKSVTIDNTGATSAAVIVVRSVGLASKAFLIDSVMYFLTAYQSDFQPSYFLINLDGDVVAKLAYSNGGGYLLTGLPNITVTDNLVQIPYLIKDLIQAANKSQGFANPTGIYSQTGINLVSFTIGTNDIVTSEIGHDLHLSGGFLWMYDGFLPVEHNFHVWPDNVEGAFLANFTTTGDTNTSNQITGIASMTNITVGMKIAGTDIPINTTVIAVDEGNSSLTMSAAATGSSSGVTLTFSGAMSNQQYFYQVVYEWADNQGNIFRSAPSIPTSVALGAHTMAAINIPTLRLTYKVTNLVNIVVYRWSTAQQNYYQTTSIQVPILNDTTIDYVTFIDTHSDAEILGNNLIYTTGGVVEDIAAPATDTMTLYKSRLVLLDSEDKNLLWYSKQVIENTPVEMSDLFTIFVAPTTGAQINTGPITALSALDDKLIIFKRDAIYYITGTGPDNTGANNDFSDPIFITSTVGCTNQASIVFMPQGLMFQSDKGIWLLGRDLSTQYIGAPVEKFNAALVVSAINVPGTNQVRFTLNSGLTLMYDYYYGQWGTFTNIPSISSTLYQNLHAYINSRGQVFQENPDSYLDGGNPVLMSFVSSWFSLAGLQGYQRAYYFYLLGQYLSPHKLNIQVAYDYDITRTQSTVMLPDNFNPAWGGDPLWGSSTPWGGASSLEQGRIFLEVQKCQSFQISINEVYDATFGVKAGAGLTMSGLNLVVGLKKGYPAIAPAKSFG